MSVSFGGLYAEFVRAKHRFDSFIETAQYWEDKGKAVERDRYLQAASTLSSEWNKRFAGPLAIHKKVTGKTVPESICCILLRHSA